MPTRGDRSRAIMSPSIASISLSPTPKNFITWVRTTPAPVVIAATAGATWSSNMVFISAGTPGNANTRQRRPPSPVTTASTPGAVPWGLKIGCEPVGIIA